MMTLTLSYKDAMKAKKSKAMNNQHRSAASSRRTRGVASKKNKAAMKKNSKRRDGSKNKKGWALWHTDDIEDFSQYVFELGAELDRNIWIENIDFLACFVPPRTHEYHDDDESSGYYSYDWCKDNRRYFRRVFSPGCSSCGYGGTDHNVWGLDPESDDRDLRALSQLEAAISSQLVYPPYRIELQNKVNAAYELKEKFEENFGDDSRFRSANCSRYYENDYNLPELGAQEIKVQESMEQCEAMIGRIKGTLDVYRKNEKHARSSLPILALCVYRSHLHQLAIQDKFSLEEDVLGDFLNGKKVRRFASWKLMKDSVPARAVPAVGIVLQCVLPFLLDGKEQN